MQQWSCRHSCFTTFSGPDCVHEAALTLCFCFVFSSESRRTAPNRYAYTSVARDGLVRANTYDSKFRNSERQRSDFMSYGFNSACQSQAPPFTAVSRCKLAGTVCHTLATFGRKQQSPWLLIDAALDQMLFFFPS